MQENNNETIKRLTVAEMPLIRSTIKRLGFERILKRQIKSHGNQRFHSVDLLMLLVYNIACGRTPFYELQQWLSGIDSRIFGYTTHQEDFLFDDDIFGRALDKLYEADRASLITEIAVETVKGVKLDLDQIHNDSTTVKAFGRYPGKTKTNFYVTEGKSKDHRPDLKQLLFTLTISADGAVPIHYKTYPGNRSDDTTHIDTWKHVCAIKGSSDFVYVADSKVCTDSQLSYITGNGGRVVTIMPETWKECREFKQLLRRHKKTKKRILRKLIPGSDTEYESYSAFTEETLTHKRSYRIHWIYSSEKKIRDRESREKLLKKAERELSILIGRINQRNLKTREQITEYIDGILTKYNVKDFYHTDVKEIKEYYRQQKKRGRPGKDTQYKTTIKTVYTIAWARNTAILSQEKKVDGVFPLLATDGNMSPKDVLKAYKYQPRLEKRFTQFKNIHNAAPLLFKKLERIEAVMFVFFLALIVQAVIEREIRKHMKENDIQWLPIYPEGRIAYHPTTAKVFDRFENVSVYQLKEGKILTKELKDPLTPLQLEILGMLGISEKEYWSNIF